MKCIQLKERLGRGLVVSIGRHILRLGLQETSQQSTSAMNAEMFFRGKDNIPTLLELLSDQTDFYVRYHIVRLLTTLAHSSTNRIAQASCLVMSRL